MTQVESPPAAALAVDWAHRQELANALSLVGIYRALLEEYGVPLPEDRTGEQTLILNRREHHLASCAWRVCEGEMTVGELREEFLRLHKEQPVFVS